MNKKGFTLIEMLTVLVILALISIIGITAYTGIIGSSRKKLNEEQKTRLVEIAKDVTIRNWQCLNMARENVDGAKITFEEMKNNGLIANNVLKDLETNAPLNSCVVVKYDSLSNDYTYNYSTDCTKAVSCIVSTTNRDVIISGFSLDDATTTDIGYVINYSTKIEAEYCVTSGEECEWKKLDAKEVVESGSVALKDQETVIKLYIRDKNQTIISTNEMVYKNDLIAPSCTWEQFDKGYINNGSSATISLNCKDESGIKNEELLSSSLEYDSSLISVSKAIIKESTMGKSYKFVVTGKNGNGSATLKLKPGVISDKNENKLNLEVTSGSIKVDNIGPDATISAPERVTTTDVAVGISNASTDLDQVCIRNDLKDVCLFESYKTSYNFQILSVKGTKKIYVTLKDIAGNTRDKVVETYVDITKPVCIARGIKVKSNLKSGDYNEYVINCVDENNVNIEKAITKAMIDYDSTLLKLDILSTGKEGTRIKITALSNVNGETPVYLKADQISSYGKYNDRTKIIDVYVDNTRPVCTFGEIPIVDISRTEEPIVANVELTCTDANGISNELKKESFTISLDEGATDAKISIESITSSEIENGKKFVIGIVATNNGETTLTLNEGAITDQAGNGNIEVSGTVQSRKTLKMSFNKNGGSGTVNAKTCTIITGTKCGIKLPSNKFTRSGYSFVAWGTSKTATSGKAPGTTVNISADTTRYAIWEANSSSSGGDSGGGDNGGGSTWSAVVTCSWQWCSNGQSSCTSSLGPYSDSSCGGVCSGYGGGCSCSCYKN